MTVNFIYHNSILLCKWNWNIKCTCISLNVKCTVHKEKRLIWYVWLIKYVFRPSFENELPNHVYLLHITNRRRYKDVSFIVASLLLCGFIFHLFSSFYFGFLILLEINYWLFIFRYFLCTYLMLSFIVVFLFCICYILCIRSVICWFLIDNF